MASTKDSLNIFGDGSCLEVYRFNSSLSGLNATTCVLDEGNETYVTAKFDEGVSFDGVTQLSSPNPMASATDKSVSLHVQVNQAQPDYTYLCNMMDDANFLDLRIQVMGDGRVRITLYDSDMTYHFVYFTYTIGQLHHIVVTEDTVGGVLKIYVDEVIIYDIATWVGYAGIYAFSMTYGARDNGNYSTNCVIDQVRFFNRYLTLDDVEQLYTEEIPELNKTSFIDTREVPQINTTYFSDTRAIDGISVFHFDDTRAVTPLSLFIFSDKRDIYIGTPYSFKDKRSVDYDWVYRRFFDVRKVQTYDIPPGTPGSPDISNTVIIKRVNG